MVVQKTTFFLYWTQFPWQFLGGGFKDFYFHLYLGKISSNLTMIFFNWVGKKPPKRGETLVKTHPGFKPNPMNPNSIRPEGLIFIIKTLRPWHTSTPWMLRWGCPNFFYLGDQKSPGLPMNVPPLFEGDGEEGWRNTSQVRKLKLFVCLFVCLFSHKSRGTFITETNVYIDQWVAFFKGILRSSDAVFGQSLYPTLQNLAGSRWGSEFYDRWVVVGSWSL